MLNKAVVNSIHRLVQSPDPKEVRGLITTGSIFRYLECQEQLGEEVCEKLSQLLKEELKAIDAGTLIKVYSAMSKGYFSTKPFATQITNTARSTILKKAPSQRSGVYQ